MIPQLRMIELARYVNFLPLETLTPFLWKQLQKKAYNILYEVTFKYCAKGIILTSK